MDKDEFYSYCVTVQGICRVLELATGRELARLCCGLGFAPQGWHSGAELFLCGCF